MSRYYSISITPKIGSSPWTSFPNGVNDPGALNVELDLFSGFFGSPNTEAGASTVTIHGVPLSDIQQAQNFYQAKIVIRGGMQAGLPLAVPSQAGLLLQGQILQGFGNWIGTEQSLSLVVSPSVFTLGNPGNFVFNWQPRQLLSDALSATLNTAYAGQSYFLKMSIGNNYATASPITHTIPTLTKFAQFLHRLNGVSGVNISVANNTILVTDGSTQKTAKEILFTDLIGQPKWVDQLTMQFMTVMRADIQPATYVTMPVGFQNSPGLVTTTVGAQTITPGLALKYKTAFQGKFIVQSIRHVGNFRDPDGASWATIFQAVVAPKAAPNG